MKLKIIILSILFLFVTASLTLSAKFSPKEQIGFIIDEISSSSEESKDDDTTNALSEVEIIGNLNSNSLSFFDCGEQSFVSFSDSYLSPVTYYNSPPPQYV